MYRLLIRLQAMRVSMGREICHLQNEYKPKFNSIVNEEHRW